MTIKVLSYNIHKGFSHFGLKFTLHALREGLRKTNADVLLLQEVVGENRNHEKIHKDWPKESQFEFLADAVWPHFSYGKNAVFTQRHHGNAVLSRFPILKWEHIDISNNRWEQRGILHCELDLKNKKGIPLHVCNVHLDLTQKGREQQIRRVIQRIEDHVPSKAPLILGGDFNDWNSKLTSSLLESLHLKESFLHQKGKHAKSFPSFFPLLCLDRIYFRELEVRTSHVLTAAPWPKLSDHLPIWAEFKLN